MQLTLYTDYSLRVLIYLSLYPEKLVTISEITDFYDISRNHLVKVVHNLSQKGFITSTRGKHGGIKLATAAENILVGQVVRATEPNFDMLACFDEHHDGSCRVLPLCKLKGVIDRATEAFLAGLDEYTLADVLANPPDGKTSIIEFFGLPPN
jgi:Rrf2 family nitric oxide-sensitive transcriptional repressor